MPPGAGLEIWPPNGERNKLEHNISPADDAQVNGGQKNVDPDTTTAPLLRDDHLRELTVDSGIPLDLVHERVYRTIATRRVLAEDGYSESQQRVIHAKEGKHALGMPIHWPGREPHLGTIKPDAPRVITKGNKTKKRKYEIRSGMGMVLDSPPRCHPMLGNPSIPLFHTEGIKKVDAGAARGGCWVGLLGVSGWRGTNEHGGKTALPELEDIALNGRRSYLVFDSDIMEKQQVHQALGRYMSLLKGRGSDVRVIYLPNEANGEKMGVDDYFVAYPNATLADLIALSEPSLRPLPHELSEQDRVIDVLPGAPAAPELVVPLGYELREGSVVQVEERWGDDGEIKVKRTTIAKAPVFLAGRMKANGGSHEESLVLYFLRAGRWERRVVPRGHLMEARKIVSLASGGFPTTSRRAPGMVDYLEAFESANIDAFPTTTLVPTMGSHRTPEGRAFLLGNRCILSGGKIIDTEETDPRNWTPGQVAFAPPDEGDKQLALGYHKKGTYEGWLDTIRPLPEFPIALFGFYTPFAAPLLEILETDNFVVDFAYQSSTGKTTLLRLLMSAFGCTTPGQERSIIRPWKSSRVYRERAAAALNGLPFALDDTKTAPDAASVESTIYEVAFGSGAGRGTIHGIAKSSSFKTVLITTGERPATTFVRTNSQGAGVSGGSKARVLGSYMPPFNDTSDATAAVIDHIDRGVHEHYGHAAERFIAWLLNNEGRYDELRALHVQAKTRYRSLAGGNSAVARLADNFAAVEVAAHAVHLALPDLPWDFMESFIEDIHAELSSAATEIDRAEAALRIVLEVAVSRSHEFYGRNEPDDGGVERPPNQGWLGLWDSGDDYAYIGFLGYQLHKILMVQGFDDAKSIIKLWIDRGWLVRVKDRQGKERGPRRRVAQEMTYLTAISREAIDLISPGGADE
jgi:putative DNA primase/helicase